MKKRMIAIVLMSFGGLVFLSGFLLFQKSGKEEMGKKELNKVIEIAIADGILTKNEKIKIGQLAEKNNLDFDSVILDAENKLQLLGINSETELIDYNAKNGYDFEKYIVQRFNKKFYKIKSWAGDKYVGGQYAESNMEPDILFELNLGRDSSQFYVECKWRKQYYKNGIEFATEKQFERYKKFYEKTKIPVYIAIGVGGTGLSPENVFIIPISKLKKNFIPINNLKEYEKMGSSEFYFDKENLTLR